MVTAILADGVNLGLTRMAEACPGVLLSTLSQIATWQIRDETYSEALAENGAPVSGLQVGERPAGFTVWTVTGPKQGTTLCYRCRYGIFPTVCIFAREISKSLTELIARIDALCARTPELKCFVVFLTDDDIENQLQAIAREKDLKHIPLTTLKPSDSPLNYRIAEDAGVTVMIWKDLVVRSNHAFARMADTDLEAVLGDLPKVLGK